MKKGDKFLRINPYFSKKEYYTYTGVIREIKEVSYHFFTDEKGETVLFTPFEVDKEFRKIRN